MAIDKTADEVLPLRPAIAREAVPAPPRLAAGTVENIPIVSAYHDLRHEDVAKIVHDFKGPLNTIALETSLFGERYACGDPVDVPHVVDKIARNVEFLDRLAQDLLDLCGLATGHFELRRETTDLRVLLETVIERVVSTRERDRVFLFAPATVTVDIDDLRIQRVVANLLYNALKYAPAGSGVIVRLDREPTLARISVSDAGHGLSDLAISRIFDKYRDGRPASLGEGTGLGLALSKQIIEAHGASIGVDRIRGEGTRFSLEFPVAS